MGPADVDPMTELTTIDRLWRCSLVCLVSVLTLTACSEDSTPEVDASPNATAETVAPASTSTRVPPVGRAEASVPSMEAVPEALAFGTELWKEMGANDEQARCYAEMFENEGWAPQTGEDIAELQMAFTETQSAEFASC